MVAPNSPIALAKHRIAPAIMPGRQSGRVTVTNTQSGWAPSVPAAALQPRVDGLDRQADGAHHQRKAHDRAGQRRAGPAEGEDDAELLVEEGADRPAPAEQDQQQVAGHHRRQDQRQVDQRVDQALPQNRRRASSQATAMPNGRLASVAVMATRRLSRTAVHSSGVMSELADFTRTVKPCFSNAAPRLALRRQVEERLGVGRSSSPWSAPPDR